MSPIESSHNNLLDTTDCLEAVGVFKGWKNLLFIILFIALLLSQACFWLVNLGWVPINADNSALATEQLLSSTMLTDANEPNSLMVEVVNPGESIQQEQISNINSEANLPLEEQQSSEQTQTNVKKLLSSFTFETLQRTLKFINGIMILSGILYCLTLLFGLKVSMLGRLGGINHITRAFFLSLFLLILLLPWQRMFDFTVVGAIFTPEEMVAGVSMKTGVLLEKILYYMRFTGYSVLILLLLILAQIRSCRWAGAILRRLEII